MSEPASGGASAQPAPNPPAEPKPAAAPAAPATEPAASAEPQAPEWLPGRLEQARAAERKRLLQELGADDPAALKAKLKKLDELETAKLSDQERVEKLIKELTPKAEQAERLQTMFSSLVESKFSALTEQQQTAIDTVANGNAEERWKLIQVMEAAGFSASPAAPTAPKPAQTVPAGASPPPPSAEPKTAFDKWTDLQKTSPVQASLFYQMNAMAIEQSRKS